MTIALLADVHGNIEALLACLRHADDRGADRYAFLGDFVGYGADPAAVTDIVADFASRGAIVVKGNHEAAVERETRGSSDLALQSAVWTRGALTEVQKQFLASLPLLVRDGPICFVHSSARAPEQWEYVESSAAARSSIEAAGATYVFSGHVHDQMLYFLTPVGKIAPFRPISGSAIPVPSHRRWLALAGSVGQPRDGDPAAAYALFDEALEQITFYRVPYDHQTAARKIREAGLPADLAGRLGPAV
jgi:diadenosine tetraphosphatase ApaH/serine/threonine PP2A family protein phosphatase